mmetsp:Transcript_64054/g.147559  ORF Transcript_64054/g.147559 Transcript_64054/m.147559 type:complete len:237 (+) Transcript_64054:374-1084(+)
MRRPRLWAFHDGSSSTLLLQNPYQLETILLYLLERLRTALLNRLVIPGQPVGPSPSISEIAHQGQHLRILPRLREPQTEAPGRVENKRSAAQGGSWGGVHDRGIPKHNGGRPHGLIQALRCTLPEGIHHLPRVARRHHRSHRKRIVVVVREIIVQRQDRRTHGGVRVAHHGGEFVGDKGSQGTPITEAAVVEVVPPALQVPLQGLAADAAVVPVADVALGPAAAPARAGDPAPRVP